MKELEEHIIREYTYNDHHERMMAVRKNFTVARIYNVYISAVFWIISLVNLNWAISNSLWGLVAAELLAGENTEMYYFPFSWVTVWTAFFVALFSILADAFLNKKFSAISFWIHLLTLVLTVLNLIFKFQPMKIVDSVILLIYSFIGMWTEDFAIRSYKELDYLSEQEGYPDFNPLLEIPRHSKFVKYRNKWLEKTKKLEYYADNEKPIDDLNVTVTAAETSSEMDGVSVDIEKQSDWFEGKDPKAPKPRSDLMDEIVNDEEIVLPDESEYIVEDVRRKPLL